MSYNDPVDIFGESLADHFEDELRQRLISAGDGFGPTDNENGDDDEGNGDERSEARSRHQSSSPNSSESSSPTLAHTLATSLSDEESESTDDDTDDDSSHTAQAFLDLEASESDSDTDSSGSDDNIDGERQAGVRVNGHGSSHKRQYFPQFSRLPVELRMRIWECFCPDLTAGTRVYDVLLSGAPGKSVTFWESATLGEQTRAFRTLLQINHETHALALRAKPDSLPMYDQYSKMYFNAYKDIILISHCTHPLSKMRHWNAKGAFPSVRANVKNLAVDEMLLDNEISWYKVFPNVETFYILYELTEFIDEKMTWYMTDWALNYTLEVPETEDDVEVTYATYEWPNAKHANFCAQASSVERYFLHRRWQMDTKEILQKSFFPEYLSIQERCRLSKEEQQESQAKGTILPLVRWSINPNRDRRAQFDEIVRSYLESADDSPPFADEVADEQFAYMLFTENEGHVMYWSDSESEGDIGEYESEGIDDDENPETFSDDDRFLSDSESARSTESQHSSASASSETGSRLSGDHIHTQDEDVEAGATSLAAPAASSSSDQDSDSDSSHGDSVDEGDVNTNDDDNDDNLPPRRPKKRQRAVSDTDDEASDRDNDEEEGPVLKRVRATASRRRTVASLDPDEDE